MLKPQALNPEPILTSLRSLMPLSGELGRTLRRGGEMASCASSARGGLLLRNLGGRHVFFWLRVQLEG